MPKSPEELFAFLDGLGITVTTRRHEPLFTVADSRQLRGEIPGAHTKNLFVKDKKDSYFLLTVEEEASVDLKSVHQLIGAAGRVSFGKPEALMKLLGVAPGAVTVFGAINDPDGQVKVVIDAALAAEPLINAHPLINTATTTIASVDLMRFIRATGHEPAVLNLTGGSPHAAAIARL
jgi:Ala-tRNA(Pro) deacylase